MSDRVSNRVTDQVIIIFENIDRDERTRTQPIFTREQMGHYLNQLHVDPPLVWSRMTATVTTPNETSAEFVLTSSEEDMVRYFQMCENIATVIYRSENPYTDFLRFLDGVEAADR